MFLSNVSVLYLYFYLDDHAEIYQIDLASTLSILLGLPIPLNNLGVLLPHSLDNYNIFEQLQAYYANGQQISSLFEESVADRERGTILKIN